ncbi:MAG: Smr/MutS family protein [Acidobacteriota bacterium]|nr:Smr/MutS family protein [Acidobacteriota bacterium]
MSELDDGDIPEFIEVEITDVIDLHTFQPREVADVVRDYLDAAYDLGLRELRIIHGRGIGVQREIVRKILSADARVERFDDAPGRGATLLLMR